MRAPDFSSSWWKWTSLCRTAAYSFTGTFTRPKLIEPDHTARAIVGLLRGAPLDGARMVAAQHRDRRVGDLGVRHPHLDGDAVHVARVDPVRVERFDVDRHPPGGADETDDGEAPHRAGEPADERRRAEGLHVHQCEHADEHGGQHDRAHDAVADVGVDEATGRREVLASRALLGHHRRRAVDEVDGVGIDAASLEIDHRLTGLPRPVELRHHRVQRLHASSSSTLWRYPIATALIRRRPPGYRGRMTSEEERLEEIEEDIQEAKRKATDDGLIEGGHHGHRFFESGDEP